MFRTEQHLPKYNPSPGLVRMTYRLLMQDKAMVAVLFVGGTAATVVLTAILVPAWAFAHITPDVTSGGLPGLGVYAAALWSASFISTLTTGVVVAAAQIRCEGGVPDVRRAFAVAWSRRGPLAAWAALSTLVGLLMQVLERLGVAGILVRALAGIGWAVATVFAVPVLIAHGTGPVETTRQSAHIVKHQLGPVVRSGIRLGAPWIFAMVLTGLQLVVGVILFAVGIDEHTPDLTLIGAGVMVTGGVGFFFCSVTSSALFAYLHTLLYRYATGLPVPEIQPHDLPPAPA